MNQPRSITWRITLALTLLTCVAVSLAAIVTFYVYLGMQSWMIDKLIATESERIAVRVARFNDQWQGQFERDMGPSMYVWGESPNVRADSMPDELRALPLGLHYLDKGSHAWHVHIAKVMDGRLYVMYDSVVVAEQLRRFALALALIVLGFSVLACLASRSVARWLVHPLNTLTDRLARWAPGQPLQGIAARNEAERLLEAFNRVQDQVDSAIADQRAFSANLHHEIRTPLTVIRSDAELLAIQLAASPPATVDRLQRIIASVDEIQQSLESTYSLTQARSDTAETLELAACVNDIVESQSVEAAHAGLVIANHVPQGHNAHVAGQALMTVMRNIIRNAMLHAAPATLQIHAITGGLQFTDSGPGISAADLPHIFERYFSLRRTDQHPATPAGQPASRNGLYQTGLGLAIAKRMCELQGWSLTVESPVAEGCGTRFTLLFTPRLD